MKIAISGCGIAGTAVAIFLREDGHEVTIFEQAKECRPVGAGIMLHTSGQNVLAQMGILEPLIDVSERLESMTAKLVSGQTLVKLKFGKYDDQIFSLGVHRGRLFDLLMKRCVDSGVEIKTDSRVTQFEHPTGVVTIQSADEQISSHGKFDFMIAADGSRSTLRENSKIVTRVKEYEYAALWKTGKCEFQPGELYQVVDGTHRLLGLLPIGKGESSLFWGLPKTSWDSLKRSDLDRWKDEARTMCPQAASILDSIDNFESLTFGSYRNVSMKKWHDKGVVFIGDAAHATSPHLGQGVNLALEDAIVFAKCLGDVGDFEEACQTYTQRRVCKLRYYRQLTGMLTPFFQSPGKIRGIGRDLVLPLLPKLPFVGRQMIRTLSGMQRGWI